MYVYRCVYVAFVCVYCVNIVCTCIYDCMYTSMCMCVFIVFNSDFRYQIPLIFFDCWETNLLLYHCVFSQNVSSCCQFCIYAKNEPTPLIGPGTIITIVILMKFAKYLLILPLVYCLHPTASFQIKKKKWRELNHGFQIWFCTQYLCLKRKHMCMCILHFTHGVVYKMMKTPSKSTCSSSILWVIIISFTILIKYSINGWSCYIGGQEEKHELSESMDTEWLGISSALVSHMHPWFQQQHPEQFQ